MAMSTFELLPAELRMAMVSYIARPSDLKNLCLVSKVVRDVAIRQLYHTVHIDLCEEIFEGENSFHKQGHLGHQYVRVLNFRPHNPANEELALQRMKKTLRLIPRDALTTMRCPLYMPLDAEFMTLLCEQQTEVSAVQLGPFNDSIAEQHNIISTWPRFINHLDAPCREGSLSELQFYQKILERRTGLLQRLSLRIAGEPAEDLNSQETSGLREEQLLDTVFSHLLPLGTKPRLAIKEVNLQEMSLEHVARTYALIFDFTQMKNLAMYHCTGSEAMIVHLTPLFTKWRPLLELFSWATEEVVDATEFLGQFLASFSGLRFLQICASNCTTPLDVRVLLSHANTMRDLFLDFGREHLLDSSRISHTDHAASDLVLLCHRFTKLRQLALRFRAVSITPTAEDDAWLRQMMHHVIKLPVLRILRIFTWPTAIRNASTFDYLARLDWFALRLVEPLVNAGGEAKISLKVLAFGSPEKPDYATDPEGMIIRMPNPIAYLVDITEGAYGQPRFSVRRTEASSVRFEESLWDVMAVETNNHVDQGLGHGYYE